MAAAVPAKEQELLAHRWGYLSPIEVDQAAKTAAQAATEQVRLASEQAGKLAEQTALHPVFGRLVSELGYKRTYLSSVERLVTAPIWQRQRILRPERAASIAQSLQTGASSTGGRPRLPGVISLYEDAKDASHGVVDGQHRIAALMLLSDNGVWDKKEYSVLVDVFKTHGDAEVKNLFWEINQAEPVRLVDMPGEGADDMFKAILSEAADILCAEYPEMFKGSARCRSPHVNKDVLRDEVYQSGLLARHGIRTTNELVTWLKNANDHMGCEHAKHPSGDSKALSKAVANGFYLGLDKSWLER